jgi:hypothetical protein
MEMTRMNRTMVQIVEAGIALLPTGRGAATNYLLQHGVRDSVIARVLCEPERRRPTDTPQ